MRQIKCRKYFSSIPLIDVLSVAGVPFRSWATAYVGTDEKQKRAAVRETVVYCGFVCCGAPDQREVKHRVIALEQCTPSANLVLLNFNGLASLMGCQSGSWVRVFAI